MQRFPIENGKNEAITLCKHQEYFIIPVLLQNGRKKRLQEDNLENQLAVLQTPYKAA